MRPDERRRRPARPASPDNQPIPIDAASDPDAPALGALRAELIAAGAQRRAERVASGHDRADPAFSAALRARLVAGYGSSGLADGTATGVDARDAGSLRVARRLGTLQTRRWAILAIAAAVVVAVLGSTADPFFPAPLDARATAADGATLVREGRSSPLAVGATLEAGDEVRVAVDGGATLALGASYARLQGGADVRIDDLASGSVRLELIAGRSYHRVALPAGGTYRVTTGPITWSALGTAFDLDREPTPTGVDRIRLLGLEHAVRVTGPGISATVDQGDAAGLTLDDQGAFELAVEPIDPATLDDPWLVANASADRALGLDLGVLDAGAPTPTPVAPEGTPTGPPGPTPGTTPAIEPPSSTPSAPPATRATPKPDAVPSAKATAKPTAKPTVQPTPTPRPKPSPVSALLLKATSCDGGVVLDWSVYHGFRFDHYATFSNSTGSIPLTGPGRDGATVLAGSTTGDRWQTSAHDTSGDDGTAAYYRTMAFGRSGTLLAASSVKSATVKPVADLGALHVGPAADDKTQFDWTAYAGPADCFTTYKLAMSRIDPAPSVLKGAASVVASSDQDLSAAVASLAPGTYHFRLQVLRSTELGSPSRFVVAQSDPATYVVP